MHFQPHLFFSFVKNCKDFKSHYKRSFCCYKRQIEHRFYTTLELKSPLVGILFQDWFCNLQIWEKHLHTKLIFRTKPFCTNRVHKKYKKRQ
jgi:hypothetical protein